MFSPVIHNQEDTGTESIDDFGLILPWSGFVQQGI